MTEALIEQQQKYENFLLDDPENMSLLRDTIEICLMNGDFNKALHYNDALIAQNKPLGMRSLSSIQLAQGKVEEAYQTLLTLAASSAPLSVNLQLAFCCYLAGKFEEAYQYIAPLCEKGDADVLLLAAQISHQLDKIDRAFALLNTALELSPDHSDCIGLLALLEYDFGDEDTGIQLAAKALALDANNYDALVVHFSTSYSVQSGDMDIINAMIAEHPEDRRMWSIKGFRHLAVMEFPEAEEALKRCLEIFEDYYSAELSLIWVLLYQDKTSEALWYAQNVAQRNPGLAEPRGAVALCQVLLGERDNALDNYEASTHLNDPSLFTLLSDIFLTKAEHPELAKMKFDEVFGDELQTIGALWEQKLFATEVVH